MKKFDITADEAVYPLVDEEENDNAIGITQTVGNE